MSENPKPPKQSPYSPFPFGSPLGLNVSKGTAEASMGNGLTSRTSPSSSSATFLSTLNSSFLKGRVRAKEAYGGPVMFGGNSTNSRRSRLLSASPYAAAAISSRKSHQRPLFEESTASSRRGSSAANSPSPAPSPSPSSTTSNDNGMMSSTARLIFDTLEKMSTPVRDAQKLIPSVSLSSPPRAEKRRLIAEQLDWCHDSLKKRRRPRLGHSDNINDHLNGPPLRTVFSPLPPSTPKPPRSTATKSARLVSSSFTDDAPNTSSMTSSPVVSRSLMAKNTSETIGHFDLYKTFDVDKKGGGKIRTKISENTRSSSQKVEDVPTTPAFIASFNAPSLPLKSLPVISYESKTTGTTSSNSIGFTNSTTTSTAAKSSLMISDSKPSSSKSFTFAEPSPVKIGPQDYGTEDGSGVAQFTFCLPEEAVCSSLSISKEPSPVLTSSTTDISSSYNKMPDITAQMSYAKNPLTLRSGRNNALPDVTASAGIKVATALSSESVLSFLGRP